MSPSTPSTPTTLHVCDLDVWFGTRQVLHGIDLSVQPGRRIGLVGENGSGKSSLLEMLTGDHAQAYANDLHLFGRRRGSGETVWDIKKNIGVVSSRLHRDYRVGGSVEEVL
ncbi:ATP-binding cassette domain-containing protein, partial [Nocardioides sp.]|uniref:ATP-binding cassette domain-containing protein n=1 Tax=Nocardioides sp. TaxID=35761 RepID=UPI002F414CAD